MGKIVKSDKPQGWSGSTTDRQGNDGGKWLSWGDNGPARLPTEEYKQKYDDINWNSDKLDKPTYRVKVNGKYVE